MPDRKHRKFLAGRAEPLKFFRVEGRLPVAVERLERDRVLEQADGGAVAGCDRVKKIGCSQSAGAGHVLHHEGRIARHVLLDVARDQPRHGVEAPAGARRHDELDLLVSVEVGDRLRRRSGRCQDRGGDRGGGDGGASEIHDLSPSPSEATAH